MFYNAKFDGYRDGSVYTIGIFDNTVKSFGIISTNETNGIEADLVLSEEFLHSLKIWLLILLKLIV